MPEIQKMLVGSTSHVCAATRAGLEAGDFSARIGRYGWCFPALDDYPPETPADMAALYQAAADAACTFIMLDADGDEIEGLLVFDDWK